MKKSLALIALLVGSTSLHAQEELAKSTLRQSPPPPPPPLVATRVPIEARAIKGAPYSAELVIESTQTLADGNRIVSRTTGRIYRDSEGRVRREEDRPSGYPAVSISDPDAGTSYMLDTERRIAWKTPTGATAKIVEFAKVTEAYKREAERSAQAGAEQRTPESANAEQRRAEELRRAATELQMQAKISGGRGGAIARLSPGEFVEEKLAPRTIENVRAEGIRRTLTIPAGQIGNLLPIKVASEEWTSPDLKVLVLTQHSDPRIGESSYRLLNIIRGDPNPSFFQVPPDYTVRETGIRKMEPLNRP